jgi:hypothetical protein
MIWRPGTFKPGYKKNTKFKSDFGHMLQKREELSPIVLGVG